MQSHYPAREIPRVNRGLRHGRRGSGSYRCSRPSEALRIHPHRSSHRLAHGLFGLESESPRLVVANPRGSVDDHHARMAMHMLGLPSAGLDHNLEHPQSGRLKKDSVRRWSGDDPFKLFRPRPHRVHSSRCARRIGAIVVPWFACQRASRSPRRDACLRSKPGAFARRLKTPALRDASTHDVETDGRNRTRTRARAGPAGRLLVVRSGRGCYVVRALLV
jgi:hypothetical protein